MLNIKDLNVRIKGSSSQGVKDGAKKNERLWAKAQSPSSHRGELRSRPRDKARGFPAGNNKILHGVNLNIGEDKVHVLMGPNGSGKSTLAQTLMGHPNYAVISGDILFNKKSILDLDVTQRANLGIFLSFQYPSEVTGVTISSFLRLIYNKSHNIKLSPAKFRKILQEKMTLLKIDESFATRYLNEGFSGGEKKRMEMLQMLVLEPKLVILDETDSGLDVDALKIVANAVNFLKKETSMSVLLITHYTRILNYVNVDKVHIMQNGKIVKEGDKSLANDLEKQGFAPFGK